LIVGLVWNRRGGGETNHPGKKEGRKKKRTQKKGKKRE
jgi:hypothetical protein